MATPPRSERWSTALTPSPRRLDLGQALATAGEVLAPETRPGEIVLATDLQATAVTPADPRVPVLVVRPARAAAAERRHRRHRHRPQPWSFDGGRVVVSLAGRLRSAGSDHRTPRRARPARQALGLAGGAATVALTGAPGGWWPITAELDPDELKADDRRVGAVRIAPVARARWDPAERLRGGGGGGAARRIGGSRAATRSRSGKLGPGISIVEPPERSGGAGCREPGPRAPGRRLDLRRAGDGLARSTDSGARTRPATRAQALRAGAGGERPHRRAGARSTGAPWIVRGGGVVVLGSRLDPAWTDLPVSAGFMPFMDFLLNRVARGEVAVIEAAPGDDDAAARSGHRGPPERRPLGRRGWRGVPGRRNRDSTSCWPAATRWARSRSTSIRANPGSRPRPTIRCGSSGGLGSRPRTRPGTEVVRGRGAR